jgi:hypothetical protein
VIQKRELVVARQRCKPQRQLGEIGRERVLIDAVEAPLRNQAARVSSSSSAGINGFFSG